MAVRLSALVDAWKQDRRAASTVELAELLVRALAKNPRATALDLKPVTDFAMEAVRRHERDLEPLLAVARLLIRTGDLARAHDMLELVGRIAPAEPRLHRLIGEICLHRGDHRGAELHFSEAASLKRGGAKGPASGGARPSPSSAQRGPSDAGAAPPSRRPDPTAASPRAPSSPGPGAAARAVDPAAPVSSRAPPPAQRPPVAVSRPSAAAGKYAVVSAPVPSTHTPGRNSYPSIEDRLIAPLDETPRRGDASSEITGDDEFATEVMSGEMAAALLMDLELSEDEDGETIVRGLGDFPALLAAHAAAAAEPAPGGIEDEDSADDDATFQIHREGTFSRVVASLWGPSGAPVDAVRRASAVAAPAGLERPPSLPDPTKMPASVAERVKQAERDALWSASSRRPLQAQPSMHEPHADLGGEVDALLAQSAPRFELEPPPPSSRGRNEHARAARSPPFGVGLPAGRPPDPQKVGATTAVPPINLARAHAPRRGKPFVVIGVLCAIALGVVVGVIAERSMRGKPSRVTSAATLRYGRVVALEVHILASRGGPRALAEADRLLTAATALANSSDAALARVRERALTLLEADAKSTGLTPAMERARAVGVPEGDIAVGDLAAAVAGRDAARAREIVARHDRDPGRATDSYWQLAVGAALDLAADPASIERYRACLALDAAFAAAEWRLVRALLLAGDVTAAEERLAAHEGARSGPAWAALRGLAWGVRREGPPPGAATNVHDDPDLPLPLRAAALVVAGSAGTYLGGLGGALRASIEEADAPAVALLTAYVASDAGNRAIVWTALERALALDPSSSRVATGVARLVYVGGNIKELELVAAKLPPRDRAAVSALVAYEANDLAELTRLSEATPDPPPTLAAARHRLRGEESRPADLLARLRGRDIVGGDALAVDLLLDVGDIASARAIVAGWPVGPHPLRAHRRARLARYSLKMDEARVAIAAAAPTRLARIERALLEAELKEPSAQVDADLDALRPWLSAYQHAMRGDAETARRALGSLAPPEPGAPLLVRIAAAAALGAMADRRNGVPLIRPLLNAWPKNPDVVRSAVFVGLLPKTALAPAE